MRNNIRVSVIGLGYIGLPTAALIASKKISVLGFDINANVVSMVNAGEPHISENNLADLLKSTVQTGYLTATNSPQEADIHIIAVPTPLKTVEFTNEPDISFINNAITALSRVVKKGDLIILESTVPVGTTTQISNWLTELRPDLSLPTNNAMCPDVHIAHCPERVIPGNVLSELVQNDRIIGGLTKSCSQKAKSFYALFTEGELVITDSKTAEMCKLVENASRDVQIAFANELSILCDESDIDVGELILLANRHPRVNILKPGPGVGGHCIAVDPWFIIHSNHNSSRLMRTARKVNDYKPTWVAKKAKIAFNSHDFKRLICLGLTYKENIDDLRESPSLKIYQMLKDEFGDAVYAVEPNIDLIANASLISVDQLDPDTDILLPLVTHKEFEFIDVDHFTFINY